MSNPFEIEGELPGTAYFTTEPAKTWTEAETCEAWGGCEQHPLPAVEVEQAEAAGLVVRPESPAVDPDACPKCGRLHFPWCAPHGGVAALTGRANGKTTSAAELLAEVREEKRATIAPVVNRADQIRAIAATEAVAKALREQLTGEARTEWEGNGTRASYDVPGIGKLVASIDQAGIVVDNRDDWMGYAKKRWPDEIVMVPTFRNPAFEKTARAAFENLFADVEGNAAAEEFMTARVNGIVLDDEGATVPGLRWTEGGTFRSASLTVDSKLKRHVADVARKYVAGEGPLEIEGGH